MNVFSSRNVELKGTKIVEASAGTGKTYSIAVICLRLVLSGVEIKEILAVTFTQAATAELKGRIMKFIHLALIYLKGKDYKNDDDFDEIKEIVDSFEDRALLLKRMKKAYSGLDELSVFTIHGFCKRILSENAFESGVLFNMQLATDNDEVLTDAVQSFWRKNVPDMPADVLERISGEKWFDVSELKHLVKERLVFKDVKYMPDVKKDVVSWKEQKGLFGVGEADLCSDLMTLLDELSLYCTEYIDRERERTGILSFDDLLILLERTLEDKDRKKLLVNTMKERYLAVLIDEFQDTDPLQYRIFNTFFGNGDHILFYIGDPKQSIYSFRNADIFAYLNAISQMPEEDRYTMNVNYRSTSRVVDGVTALFKMKQGHPFEIEGIDMPHVSAKDESENKLTFKGKPCNGIDIRFMRADSFSGYELSKNASFKKKKIKVEPARSRAIDDMVFTIVEMLKDDSDYRIGNDKVKASNIAVLVDTNRDANTVRKSLSFYCVPVVTASNVSVYDSVEANDLLVISKAMANPIPGRVKAALLTMFFRENIQYIQSLENDLEKMESWIFFFCELEEVWNQQGFLSAFNKFFNSYSLSETLASQTDGERALTNVSQLTELLHKYEQENLSSPGSTLDWFCGKITEAGSAEEEQLRLESDADAVNIVTIHKSKGLDYPIVFCPAMWKKAESSRNAYYMKYHDEDKSRVLSFEKSSNYVKDMYRSETLSENLRLVYVALTRAKYNCTIYWGNIYGMGSSALANIFHGVIGYRDFAKCSDDNMLLDLINVEDSSKGSIKVRDELKTPNQRLFLRSDEKKYLTNRDVESEISATWSITSFSSLSYHAEGFSEVVDPELFEENSREPKDVEPLDDPGSIHSFPAGAAAGTALHAIFEEIDFKSSDNLEIIGSVLERHNLRYSDSEEDMTPWVQNCVNSVLDSPVFEGKNLRDVKPDEMLTEMEFFFEIDDLKTAKINKLFKGKISVPENTANGYIHGFIDLVFKLNGKYYIVDWKSNKLGERKEDYTDNRVIKEMKKHNYIFQYMIYASALDRYLSINSKSYKYEVDFGGASYVFLRGPAFYSDKPDPDTFRKFNEILRGNG